MRPPNHFSQIRFMARGSLVRLMGIDLGFPRQPLPCSIPPRHVVQSLCGGQDPVLSLLDFDAGLPLHRRPVILGRGRLRLRELGAPVAAGGIGSPMESMRRGGLQWLRLGGRWWQSPIDWGGLRRV
jgi:hypothetical protein